MADLIPNLDTHPCERATALRAARDKIIMGTGVAEYDFEAGNGVRRRVRYTAADVGRLETEISKAEKQCALKNKKRPTRFAVAPRGGGW